MKTKEVRTVVDIILIDSGKLLLVKKGIGWYLPGRTIEQDELPFECLEREMGEELPNSFFFIGKHFGEFDGISPNSHRQTKMIAFLGQYLGGSIEPSREISESRWVSPCDFESLNISEITQQVILKLQEEDRL